MSIVYILHEPVRYDRVKRIMVPIDLNPAKEYGDLVVVFPGRDRPPPIDECADDLRAAMARFKPADRLLIAGDMDLLIFASILAAKACGTLVLLKWHSRDRHYQEIKAPKDLFAAGTYF